MKRRVLKRRYGRARKSPSERLFIALRRLKSMSSSVELDAKSYGWSRLATRTLASQVRLKYAKKVAP
jgi:hypothetical protein